MDDPEPTSTNREPIGLTLRLRTSPALRRAIPARLDMAVAELRGRRAWKRSSPARGTALSAMAAIVGGTEREAELEELARRWVIEAHAWDVFFWRPWRAPRLDGASRELLATASATGRGVLLSSCHIGPFFLSMGAVVAVLPSSHGTAGPWLFEQGSGAWGRKLERWRRGIADRGEDLVRSGGAYERIAALLEGGEAVQVYFDMPGSRPTAFLGKPVMLARGSARLAKRAEALVMPIHTRREGHRAVTSIGAALDAREYASVDALHDALAVLHERAILQTPEQLEDPNRAGAWEGGATAAAWMRPGDRPPPAEVPATHRGSGPVP